MYLKSIVVIHPLLSIRIVPLTILIIHKYGNGATVHQLVTVHMSMMMLVVVFRLPLLWDAHLVCLMSTKFPMIIVSARQENNAPELSSMHMLHIQTAATGTQSIYLTANRLILCREIIVWKKLLVSCRQICVII